MAHDADGNGQLTYKEMMPFCRKIAKDAGLRGQLTARQMDDAFEQADLDKNNMISPDEFVAFYPKYIAFVEEEVRAERARLAVPKELTAEEIALGGQAVAFSTDAKSPSRRPEIAHLKRATLSYTDEEHTRLRDRFMLAASTPEVEPDAKRSKDGDGQKKSTRNPAYLAGSTRHSSVSRTLKGLFASNDAPSTTDKKSSILGWLSSKSLTSNSKKQGDNKPVGRKYGKVHPDRPAAAASHVAGDATRIDTMSLKPLQFRAFCAEHGILTETVQGAQQQQQKKKISMYTHRSGGRPCQPIASHAWGRRIKWPACGYAGTV